MGFGLSGLRGSGWPWQGPVGRKYKILKQAVRNGFSFFRYCRSSSFGSFGTRQHRGSGLM